MIRIIGVFHIDVLLSLIDGDLPSAGLIAVEGIVLGVCRLQLVRQGDDALLKGNSYPLVEELLPVDADEVKILDAVNVQELGNRPRAGRRGLHDCDGA